MEVIHTISDELSPYLHCCGCSPSFRFAVEDCIDAAFGVFMEDLHHTMYSTHAQAVAAATAAAKASDKTPPPQLQEEGQDEAQETGQSPTQEVRRGMEGSSGEQRRE